MPIQERLITIFRTKSRRRFHHATYNLLEPIARLGILLVIVQLFSPLSFDDIFSLINSLFGNADVDEIKHLISLAVAVAYVRRVGDLDDLFSIEPSAKPLLEFQKTDEPGRIRIAVIDLYREHFVDLYDLLGASVP